jgi:hypothetical protein
VDEGGDIAEFLKACGQPGFSEKAYSRQDYFTFDVAFNFMHNR